MFPRPQDRVRALLRKIRQRTGSGQRPSGRKRAKRKAALALSASVMAMNTGMIDTVPPSSVAVSMHLQDAGESRKNALELRVSDEFKQALIEEEGVREVVYRDVAGYPTVGVGHLVTPKDRLSVGDRVGYDRILDLLDRDLETAEAAVARLVGDLPLHQHEYDALVDLVFNVGEGNVSPEKSPRLNAAIAAGDHEAIAAELDYRHAGGKKARGLGFRSERRAQIFMDAQYDNPRENAV